MFQLFETIRILEGEPRNLDLHNERLNQSRKALFGCPDLLQLPDYIHVPDFAKRTITRCRVIYDTSIRSVEYTPYIPAPVRNLKTVEADTLVYDHKYLDRDRLTNLLHRNVADDILIIQNGCVTDTSFANIVFTDGLRWITPDTPLLRGTMRRWLLDEGIIEEGRITSGNLGLFKHFRLINAMLGFDAPLLPVSIII